MARSTDSKRATAKAKMPAKRSPTRRRAAAAAQRPQGPEAQAGPAEDTALRGKPRAGAPTAEAVRESPPVPTPEPAAIAAPHAVTGDAEPAASPGERPAMQPEPASPARREEVPSARAVAAGAASAPPGAAAPALEPVRAAVAEVAAAAAALVPPRKLVEGTIDMHGQMVAFACRQTEFGLAAGRAMLASRSLPEIVSLQSAFVGRSVENALAHTLEMTRRSAEILRDGLRPGGDR